MERTLTPTPESESSTGLHQASDRRIDFCVWVLEIDGLHVPPFDRHPEKLGPLQERGMDGSQWQDWIRTVQRRGEQRDAVDHAIFARWVRAGADPAFYAAPTKDEQAVIDQPLFPVGIWQGDPAVKELLAELKDEYSSVRASRSSGPFRSRTEEMENYWRLSAFQDELFEHAMSKGVALPDITLYLAQYPEPVVYQLSRSALLLGTPGRERPVLSDHRQAIYEALGLL